MSRGNDLLGRSTCPNRDLLLALTAGRLMGRTRASVESHVEECDSCLLQLQSLDDSSDTLISELRKATGPEIDVEDLPRWQSWEGRRDVESSGWNQAGDSPPLGEAAIPSRLGDYQVLERLGRGGMGTVYRAVHARLGRVVALKVIRADRAGDGRFAARFEREMRALGSLEHPNLVRALDAREEAGIAFLVMELVEGVDVARLIKREGRLSVADACEAARQAALGLEHAHGDGGLVHRDVKPSNLMIARSGCVKLLDLGIASFRPGAGRRPDASGIAGTAVDEWAGTADFMAPEQWLSSPGSDPRSDIYGLGCTLYSMLAGYAPFARPEWTTTEEKRLAHAIVAPPSIRELRGDVPAAMAAVLERMLAKCPSDRYATPAEVARALLPFSRGHDLRALVSPAEFVPSLSVGDDPGDVATRTTGAELGRIRTRREGPRPRSFPKPAVVPALLTLLTLLLAARTIADWWQRPGSAVPAVRPEPASVATPNRLSSDTVRAELTVRLFRAGPGADEIHDLGRIGAPHATAVVDQRLVVEATLAEPLFLWLFAVNADGSCESLFPDDDARPSPHEHVVYPLINRYLRLDEAGLVAFVMLASREPLPTSAKKLPAIEAAEWARVRSEVPWSFVGKRCEPLIRDRAGGLQVTSHGPVPFARLCESLLSRPGIVAVRAVAFPVRTGPEKDGADRVRTP